MALKDQLEKLKENWLLVLLILVVMIMPFLLLSGSISYLGSAQKMMDYEYSAGGSAYRSTSSYSPIYDNRDFAPDETDRKVVKTVSISTESKRGSFRDDEEKLKAIISSTDSYLLNENVNKYGTGWDSYLYGNYEIRVPANKYDFVVTQLKAIGEIRSFSENKLDITGSYTNLQIELEAETKRLDRYNGMLDEATLVADKITLADKIFDQERKIKYMEDQINNMDTTIDYSTVYFTMTEKQSSYSNIALVKFGELIRVLAGSFNSLLVFIFSIVPWLTGIILIVISIRFFKKKKKH